MLALAKTTFTLLVKCLLGNTIPGQRSLDEIYVTSQPFYFEAIQSDPQTVLFLLVAKLRCEVSGGTSVGEVSKHEWLRKHHAKDVITSIHKTDIRSEEKKDSKTVSRVLLKSYACFSSASRLGLHKYSANSAVTVVPLITKPPQANHQAQMSGLDLFTVLAIAT
jgi:hypothetical protein